MALPIKSILLIDDDEATNFLHEIVINEAQCAQQVHVVTNGEEALAYLTQATEGKYPQPDLIFLDINMPVMDGWQFLEEYQKLHLDHKGKIVIVMLTASENPADANRAKAFSEVSGFKNKPLEVEALRQIVRTYFS